jgi:hypothetical protein
MGPAVRKKLKLIMKSAENGKKKLKSKSNQYFAIRWMAIVLSRSQISVLFILDAHSSLLLYPSNKTFNHEPYIPKLKKFRKNRCL